MTNRVFLVLACLLIGVESRALGAVEDSLEWEAELHSYLERAADLLEVPGAVAVVVTRDGEARVLTYGVRCTSEKGSVTSNVSFGIGSLTKAFTATAAAALVGDGAVGWDTTARTIIPELHLRDPVATERVTLRDLLAHRSGLGNQSILHINIDAAPEWVLPRLALVEAEGEFRDQFSYSGLGYTLAGVIIGRAAGSSWSEVVSERLLGPLEMDSTTVGPPRSPGAEVACGHIRSGGSTVEVDPLVLSVGAPGNGLYSTGDDLVRWLEVLLGEGKVGDRKIVDADALRETWAPQVAIRSPGSELRAYGYGWYLSSWRGRRYIFHGGGGVGFTSQVRLFPEAGVAVAVLANRAASAVPDVLAERACELVFKEEVREELLDRAVEMTERIEALHAAAGENLRATADPGAPPSLEVSAYAGCYSNPIFGEFEVRTEGDLLDASFHGIDVAVEHLHDDVFMSSSPYMGAIALTFSVAEEGVLPETVTLDLHERKRVFTRGAGSCAERPAGIAPSVQKPERGKRTEL